MNSSRLRHLYIEELRDIYSAENQMVKALPKMAGAAASPDLKAGFAEHLEQTKHHVTRLEKIFKTLGESPKGKKCQGMAGLVAEGSEMIDQAPAPEELDAGLISAAQRVEHYEIAAYGCVAAYAKLLGENQAESLLRQTLSEEKETNGKLTELSESINVDAANSSEDSGEETQPRKSTSKAKSARA
jgi:ferritin-like metal-binding protein YciE